ncbi:MAG: hypothetical protein RMJ36_06920 [Candidatus Calescibacterium sp.]|nr:hypothetical protein [Candidatus Calescibacterium sp.]MDW8133368.1 hypothetical protein [Candidatus Calescibacterium sp.]
MRRSYLSGCRNEIELVEFRVYNRDRRQTLPVCPSCESSVLEEKYIETYIAPFNNQEYKLYHCPKCDLQWEPLKIVPEFYEQEGEEDYVIFHMGIN